MVTVVISREKQDWVEKITDVDVILVNDGYVTVVTNTGLTRQFIGKDLLIRMI